MLSDQSLTLRALEPEDLALMHRMENEADKWQWGVTNEPVSRHILRQYLERTTGDIYRDGQLRLVVELDGEAIGFADLTDFAPRHRRAELGIILQPESRGRGVGKRVLLLMAAYAFRFLHLRLLYAQVALSNVPARRAFLAAGFAEQALLPQWLEKEDGAEDVALLTIRSNE